jgi:hypothetical protein
MCKESEAYETERWALEAILGVELMTPIVVDPCAGTGMISRVAAECGHKVFAMDKHEWAGLAPMHFLYTQIGNFLTDDGIAQRHSDGNTVFMNPPFSLACEFVDRAFELGSRKIICFQRQAWRESEARREWWEKNPPSRVWVCGSRVNCWRFDLLECSSDGGHDSCQNYKRKKGVKPVGGGCRRCNGNSSTSNAFYVWERGHKGAETQSAIYPSKENANV